MVPETFSLLMESVGCKKWTCLLWEMHHTAKSGLSFYAFKNALDIIGIESGVFQLHYAMLLEVGIVPFISFVEQFKTFAFIEEVTDCEVVLRCNFKEHRLSRKEFEKGWDGKIFANEAKNNPPLVREAENFWEDAKSISAKSAVYISATALTASKYDADKNSSIKLGSIAYSAYLECEHFSLEGVIPYKCKGVSIALQTVHGDLGLHKFMGFEINLLFPWDINSVRFHFMKKRNIGRLDAMGIRGLFKVSL